MSQKLPIGEFGWWHRVELSENTGSIVEVDLEYPAALHDDHVDLPLAPEKLMVSKGMLSPWSQQRFDTLGKQVAINAKLVPHLGARQSF